MKWIAVATFFLFVSPSSAPGQERDPAPERVSLVAGAGVLEPTGVFGDRVEGGPLFSVGSFFRLNPYLAPAIAAQYALLEPDLPPGERGSFDTWRVLGGLRVFLVPKEFFLRPWLSAMAGWAHYTSYRRGVELSPVIAPNRDDRDDVLLNLGGGADLRLHPNFEIGFDVRHDVSFTDDSETGERDLHAVSILGMITFNY